MDSRPPLLYLVHRIPYPPNKGDKVRSFNILKQLARRHRVFLGTFVDHPDDERHVATLDDWCVETRAIRLQPRRARIASLRGLLSGEALSLPYYRNASLANWVQSVVDKHSIGHAVVFSGPMAQYVPEGVGRFVIDFCDFDSAKWLQYAGDHRWPLSWLYRREGERLLAFEREAARRADASVFVTDAEAALFRGEAPEVADRVVAVHNGVDSEYFAPDRRYDNPYPDGGPVVLFTGAMDYWPNIDAVTWFARDVLPGLRRTFPDLRFYIVGMNPVPSVQALAGEAVCVTGMVPDIRPWLAYADIVVAPLRVARGIQNKVLEAMSMARPVVVSEAATAGLAGTSGEHFLTARSVTDYVGHIAHLLHDTKAGRSIGEAARTCVLGRYNWAANLDRFEALLRGEPIRVEHAGSMALEQQS